MTTLTQWNHMRIEMCDDPLPLIDAMAKTLAVIAAKDLKNGIGNRAALPWPRLR